MGRIGKSYPRFQHGEIEDHGAAQPQASRAIVLGAVLGALAALALIAFIVTR